MSSQVNALSERITAQYAVQTAARRHTIFQAQSRQIALVEYDVYLCFPGARMSD